MKTASNTPSNPKGLWAFVPGLKLLPERLASSLSKLDRRLTVKQRIILFALLLTTWGTAIVIQTIGQFQSAEIPMGPIPEHTGVLMDSTLNQTKAKDHENNQH